MPIAWKGTLQQYVADYIVQATANDWSSFTTRWTTVFRRWLECTSEGRGYSAWLSHPASKRIAVFLSGVATIEEFPWAAVEVKPLLHNLELRNAQQLSTSE